MYGDCDFRSTTLILAAYMSCQTPGRHLFLIVEFAAYHLTSLGATGLCVATAASFLFFVLLGTCNLWNKGADSHFGITHSLRTLPMMQ